MSAVLNRAHEILRAEIAAIKNIPLDASFEKAVTLLARCSGKVITTGIGKAGNISQKMAGTLCSTGTPACYLHPAEAAHGDLGILAPGDIVLALSTSGKTREVIEMLELSHHLGVKHTIGITSHPDSLIRNQCSVIISMGEIIEPCPLGLTPTASTLVMMAICDALAISVMEAKKFTREQYGLRHHGGYLGQQARQNNQKKSRS